MGPIHLVEILFCTICLLLFSIMNTQIFGEIAMLITMFEKKKISYQEKLDNANTAMGNLKLPLEMVEGVHEFL